LWPYTYRMKSRFLAGLRPDMR